MVSKWPYLKNLGQTKSYKMVDETMINCRVDEVRGDEDKGNEDIPDFTFDKIYI